MFASWRFSLFIAVVALLAYGAYRSIAGPMYHIGDAKDEHISGLDDSTPQGRLVAEQFIGNNMVQRDYAVSVPSLLMPDAGSGYDDGLDTPIPETIELHVNVIERMPPAHSSSGSGEASSTADSDGVTVIFVHGGPASPFTIWEKTTAALLKKNSRVRRVVYYHARGCGRSGRPLDKLNASSIPFVLGHMLMVERSMGLAAQIADLERVRRFVLADESDSLADDNGASFPYDRRKVAVVGFSFGGFVASLYAAEFPRHVASLYLVSPAQLLEMPSPSDDADMLAAIRRRLVEFGKKSHEDQAEYLSPFLANVGSEQGRRNLWTTYTNSSAYQRFLDDEYMNVLKTLKRTEREVQCIGADMMLFYCAASQYPGAYARSELAARLAGCPPVGSVSHDLRPKSDPAWHFGGGWAGLASLLSLGLFSEMGNKMKEAFSSVPQQDATFCTTTLHTNYDLTPRSGSDAYLAVLPRHPSNAAHSVDATHFLHVGEEDAQVIETGETVPAHILRSLTNCL